MLASVGRPVDGADFERAAGDAHGGLERAPLADDQRPRVVVDLRVRQGLGDDLGPDAARIAHRDRQDWFLVASASSWLR